ANCRMLQAKDNDQDPMPYKRFELRPKDPTGKKNGVYQQAKKVVKITTKPNTGLKKVSKHSRRPKKEICRGKYRNENQFLLDYIFTRRLYEKRRLSNFRTSFLVCSPRLNVKT